MRFGTSGRLLRWGCARVGAPTLLLVAYYLLFVLWYFCSGSTGDLRRAVADGAYLPVNLAGLLLAAAVARQPRAERRARRAWPLIAVALGLQMWGDASWFWLEGVRRTAPFPSVADIGYTAMYLVMFAGLLTLPVATRSRSQRLALALDAATVAGAGFMVVWAVSLGSAVHEGFGTVEAALNIVYPVGDLVLILGATTAALRGSTGLHRRPLAILLTGLTAWIVADVGFSYISQQGDGTGGSWIDLAWIAALACFAIAADQQRRDTAAASPAGVGPAGASVRVGAPARLPYLAILLSYVVVARAALHLPIYPLGGLLLGDVAVTVAVVARQLITVGEHGRLAARYQRAATTDGLTGLLTRQHFLDLAAAQLASATSRRHPTSLLIIDVDHFKQINDGYGHLAGDAVLTATAARCRDALRTHDLLCRYGGDELVALLPDTDTEEAAAVAARLSAAVTATPVPAGASTVAITISIGHATAASGPDLTMLLGRADATLYAVKQAGRGHARGFHEIVPARPALQTVGAAQEAAG